MLHPECYVQIGLYKFKYVTEIKVDLNIDTFTDTAMIKLPKKLHFSRGVKSANAFQEGDLVIIKLGFDGRLKEVFKGYVSKIKPGIPLEIECEDEMYWLKRETVSGSWNAGASLPSIISELVPGYKTDVINSQVAKLRVEDVSPVQLLKKLKKAYGWTAFFRNNTLVVGKPYTTQDILDLPVRKFTAGKHERGISDIISDDIEMLNADQIKLYVEGINILPSNKKKTLKVGDTSGEKRQQTYYNLPEAEFEKQLKASLQLFKKSGPKGKFRAFGMPVVVPGQGIELINSIYHEINTQVLVKQIKYHYGMGGLKQQIFIGPVL